MTIDEAKFKNPLVYECYQKNIISPEDCICGLIEIIEEQQKEILRLNSIAPFKIKKEDGSFLYWNCPEKFIPERNAK